MRNPLKARQAVKSLDLNPRTQIPQSELSIAHPPAQIASAPKLESHRERPPGPGDELMEACQWRGTLLAFSLAVATDLSWACPGHWLL